MSKKRKNKIMIILLYVMSLFLFEFNFGVGDFEKNAQYCVAKGINVFGLFVPFVLAGVYHFIMVSCIAIYVRFNKKIDIEYKHIIYWFPLITFIFSMPMGTLACAFANLLGLS